MLGPLDTPNQPAVASVTVERNNQADLKPSSPTEPLHKTTTERVYDQVPLPNSNCCNALRRLLSPANFFHGPQPILLRRAAVVAALQIKLISTRANLLFHAQGRD
jgi:hypothetical protein